MTGDVLEYFNAAPLWLKVGLSMLSVFVIPLVAYIWNDQRKKIKELEVAVQQIANDQVRSASQSDLNAVENKMYREMKEMRQELRDGINQIDSRVQDLQNYLLNKK